MAEILKQNEYKCVELCHYDDGKPYIVKRYSGHSEEHLLDNTQYIYDALKFFYREFSSILQTPSPYTICLSRHQVGMEYLPDLPKARLLNFSTLKLAAPFFQRCYEMNNDQGFLRSIRGSVITTPKISALLEMDFPLSLGFKGDLRQNLCLSNGKLILADIDSICLEPLGLSEIELYGELFAATNLFPTIHASIQGIPVPVTFNYLDKSKAAALIEAVFELLELRMKNLPSPIRKLKLMFAKYLFYKTHRKHYK